MVPNAKQQLALVSEYATSPREIDMGPGQSKFKFTRRHFAGIKDVIAQAQPYTSPADMRRMVAAAKANGWMPPYGSAREEASARQAMIQQGMRALEAEIEAQSVPLEEVLEEARRERKIAYEAMQMQQAAAIVQSRMAIEQAMAAPEGEEPGMGEEAQMAGAAR